MTFGGGALGGYLKDIRRTFVGLLEDFWIFGGHLLNYKCLWCLPQNLEDIYINIFFIIVPVTQTDYYYPT